MREPRRPAPGADDHRQNLQLDLERIVPEYHSKNVIVRWLFDKRVAIAAEHVSGLRPRGIVDIGCGEGRLFAMLLQRGELPKTAVGVDANPKVLDLNGRVPRCTFQKADIFHLGFADAAFDVATCLDVLEHIQDVDRALQEIVRIIGTGGHLVTSEPVESVLYRSLRFLLKGTYSQEAGPGAGVHYYNARQIDERVRKAGFERVRTCRVPLPPPFDLFHVNLYRRSATS